MPVSSGRIHSPRSRLTWLAGVALGLGAAALLVRACAYGSLNQPVARLESGTVERSSSGERSPPSAGTGNGGMTEQAAFEREASTTKRLHELAESDPATALGLAVAGNLQSPGSADAPELGWIICRSLVNLRRFPEAVAAARVVRDQYPDTPWALDVERHLLVNPMSDPSERGYGHRSELE